MRQESSRTSKRTRRQRPECNGRYVGLVTSVNGLCHAILVFRPNPEAAGAPAQDEAVPGGSCVRATVEEARALVDRQARSYNRWMREHGARRELEHGRREAMLSKVDAPVLDGPAPRRQHWPAKPVLL